MVGGVRGTAEEALGVAEGLREIRPRYRCTYIPSSSHSSSTTITMSQISEPFPFNLADYKK